MFSCSAWLVVVILAFQAPVPSNPIYQELLDQGFVVGDLKVKLSEPTLRDGMTDLERRAALKQVPGIPPLAEMIEDRVTAPFHQKVRDVPYPGGVVRVVDLWFFVHARFDEINTDDLAGRPEKQGKGEAANMKFEVRALDDAQLKAHGKVASTTAALDRYGVNRGLLLDRIDVTTTNHLLATRSADSLVVATMTDHAFDDDKELGNRWFAIPGPGAAKKEPGPPQPYAGSGGYGKISRFSENPPILLVESHAAFAEPKAWFDGAPTLRGKISLIARDQVQTLRREIVARRKKDGTSPK